MHKIGIIGAGSWGISLAIYLANRGNDIKVWSNTEEEKEYLLKTIGIGKAVYLSGSLNSPINNTIPNNFNYKNYLYNKKILTDAKTTK